MVPAVVVVGEDRNEESRVDNGPHIPGGKRLAEPDLGAIEEDGDALNLQFLVSPSGLWPSPCWPFYCGHAQAQARLQLLGGVTSAAEVHPFFAGAIGVRMSLVEIDVEAGRACPRQPRTLTAAMTYLCSYRVATPKSFRNSAKFLTALDRLLSVGYIGRRLGTDVGKGAVTMITYVSLFKFTEQGIKNVKGTVDRTQQSRAAIEKAGGRLTAIYWTQGRYDLVAVSDWPDEESAMAFILQLGMAGNVRTETLRAFDEAAMKRLLTKVP
jgi:uncharacterized protein with GYD domain